MLLLAYNPKVERIDLNYFVLTKLCFHLLIRTLFLSVYICKTKKYK